MELTTVPLLVRLRHMEESLFLKVSAHVSDVYNDAQRGTLSTWSWLSCVLTKLKANEVKNESFTLFVP